MTETDQHCQECGNFPVPEGSPVAERIEALETALDKGVKMLHHIYGSKDGFAHAARKWIEEVGRVR